jgi:hypothetical protein
VRMKNHRWLSRSVALSLPHERNRID